MEKSDEYSRRHQWLWPHRSLSASRGMGFDPIQPGSLIQTNGVWGKGAFEIVHINEIDGGIETAAHLKVRQCSRHLAGRRRCRRQGDSHRRQNGRIFGSGHAGRCRLGGARHRSGTRVHGQVQINGLADAIFLTRRQKGCRLGSGKRARRSKCCDGGERQSLRSERA